MEVRASWTAALWPIVFLVGFSKRMDLGPALLWGVAWTLALFANVWTHEMGHIVAGRRYGIETERMTLRGLGGLAHLQAKASSPRQDVVISLAGPATHLLWLAVLGPLTWWIGTGLGSDARWPWMLRAFTWTQVHLLVFNLLPIYMLDGSRVLLALLTKLRGSGWAALTTSTVGFVGNGAFVLVGVLAFLEVCDPLGSGPFSFLLAWLGIEGIQACRQLRLEAKYGDVYGDPDPFAATLLASKQAVADMEREERAAKAKARRPAAPPKPRADSREALQEQMDRLLDRVNEVGGVDKLPRRERKELERVGRLLRDGP